MKKSLSLLIANELPAKVFVVCKSRPGTVVVLTTGADPPIGEIAILLNLNSATAKRQSNAPSRAARFAFEPAFFALPNSVRVEGQLDRRFIVASDCTGAVPARSVGFALSRDGGRQTYSRLESFERDYVATSASGPWSDEAEADSSIITLADANLADHVKGLPIPMGEHMGAYNTMLGIVENALRVHGAGSAGLVYCIAGDEEEAFLRASDSLPWKVSRDDETWPRWRLPERRQPAPHDLAESLFRAADELQMREAVPFSFEELAPIRMKALRKVAFVRLQDVACQFGLPFSGPCSSLVSDAIKMAGLQTTSDGTMRLADVAPIDRVLVAARARMSELGFESQSGALHYVGRAGVRRVGIDRLRLEVSTAMRAAHQNEESARYTKGAAHMMNVLRAR